MRSQYPSVSSPSRTSSFTSLPPGASPPIPSPNAPRSPSPFSTSTMPSIPTTKINHPRDRDTHLQQTTRKKPPPNAPVALGILRALDPPVAGVAGVPNKVNLDERFPTHSESGHQGRERDPVEKKEKKGFWNRDKEKEKERDKEKDRERERLFERERDRGRYEENPAELTRMIGYLTATAAEDWAVVLEVCDRASANENNAKEAVRALRREFKYGEPPAQLSAARLWAIMLRNSSDTFISQSTSRKFLDTLEDLLNSSRTSPVVRERVLDVIAAAAYASGSKKDSGFRGLWRRVKPVDKPDEGMPFDNDDAMFNPPAPSRLSHYEAPLVSYQEPSPIPIDYIPPTLSNNSDRKRKSPTRNRIIPPEEDIRRLFQECKIGRGNASLLSQALVLSKPEDLKKQDVIKEFYKKSLASQELIFAQIPWATAGAERSRLLKDQECLAIEHGEDSPIELTTEEQLLADLLEANEDLLEAIKQYNDLERVAMERKAEDRSRKETRMDRRHLQHLERDSGPLVESFTGGGGSSTVSSPNHSPVLSAIAQPYPQAPILHSGIDAGTLAPPPAAPHGPRSPAQASNHSRTPSPSTPILDPYGMESFRDSGFDLHSGLNSMHLQNNELRGPPLTYDNDGQSYVGPSAKALGKRKVVEEEPLEEPFDSDDVDFDSDKDTFPLDERPGSEPGNEVGDWRYQPVQYVYDAAAERTQQRIRDGHALVVNGIH
ncbi:hypothetical protein BDZ94DRAFT_1266034 [Collybia nuda]|uniref:VHS domain-containing protein n=1 Tax=Collybia nuda TaxID=64659 RepID=A0A9P5Y380_9AGAR|nr:hypothetical protein BDZ94DRAFT_1266034 [Collybia nuda]